MFTFFRGLNASSEEVSRFRRLMLEYARRNLVRVTAYIESPYTVRFTTDQVMSWNTFIANLGGMMGLCMGMSFVSIVEVLYFAALAMARSMK